MSDRLRRLSSEQGQSPWLDNLQRSFVTDGTLRDIIGSGIRGLTSNPTIFQKAIQGSADYDEQFASEISVVSPLSRPTGNSSLPTSTGHSTHSQVSTRSPAGWTAT